MQDLFFLTRYPVEAGFTTIGKTGPERREELAERAKKEDRTVIRPVQVHSDIIASAAREPETGELEFREFSGGREKIPEGAGNAPRYEKGLIEIPDVDGVITDDPSLILTSSHGDCLPIYMYDPVHHAIGLCHSGWRGCLSGIGANMLAAMEQSFGSRPEDIVTYIGPGIDLCCFEVGAELAGDFLDRYPWIEDGYMIDDRNGKYHIDLKGMTMELLAICGNHKSSASGLCTCCREDLFWSYRRNGAKERMMAWMCLK